MTPTEVVSVAVDLAVVSDPNEVMSPSAALTAILLDETAPAIVAKLPPVSKAKPLIVFTVTLDRGVRVEICAAVRTTGTEAADKACPKAGVLVSILPREVLPVSCLVAVARPVVSIVVVTVPCINKA